MPTPRKARPATVRIAHPATRVAWTREGRRELGRTWRKATRQGRFPASLAPSTYSISRWPRASALVSLMK
jgi:hypothetical protein